MPCLTLSFAFIQLCIALLAIVCYGQAQPHSGCCALHHLPLPRISVNANIVREQQLLHRRSKIAASTLSHQAVTALKAALMRACHKWQLLMPEKLPTLS